MRAAQAPPGPRGAARGFRGCAVPGPAHGAAAGLRHFALRVVAVPSRDVVTSAGPPFLARCNTPSVTDAIFRSGSSFLPPSGPPLPSEFEDSHSSLRAISPSGLSFLPQGHHFPLRVIIFPSVSPLAPHSRTFSPRAAISPSGLSFSLQGSHSRPVLEPAANRSIWSISRISIPHLFPLQTLPAAQGSFTALQPCSTSPFSLSEQLKLPGHIRLSFFKKGILAKTGSFKLTSDPWHPNTFPMMPHPAPGSSDSLTHPSKTSLTQCHN